jgi:hypothetical protein
MSHRILRIKENGQAAQGAEGGQYDGNLSELNNLIIYPCSELFPSVAVVCSFSPKNSQATSFSFVTFLLAMKKKSKPRPA